MKPERTITRQQELETLAVIAAFLMLLDLILLQRVFGVAALLLLVIALFVKPLSRLLARLWLGFADLLGAFNARVILTILFFAVLTPVALLYRLMSRSPLRLKRDEAVGSYFDKRDHLFCRKDLEKMW